FLQSLSPVFSLYFTAKIDCGSRKPPTVSTGRAFISSVIYLAWTVFVLVTAFLIYPDPQSGIALLFIPIYSLPVMAIAWLLALWPDGSQVG
ncbi:MAG: hypothetical protein SGI77_06315, partial [Pirellulaceae bacterium]|nr:hypothetical protein [Pirellulaceae bacterium]